MPQWKTILVPTDFSDLAQEALVSAADLARALGASIQLLHVAEVPSNHDPATPVRVAGVQTPVEVGEYVRAEVTQRLERFAEPARRLGVPVSHRVVLGAPSELVIDAILASGADLVVMGTHGRTGLAHLFLGSVAERVVRRSPVPVLTVRHKPQAGAATAGATTG